MQDYPIGVIVQLALLGVLRRFGVTVVLHVLWLAVFAEVMVALFGRHRR